MMSMSMICSGQWNLLPVLHCRLCAGERGGGGDPQRGGAPGPGQHRAGHCGKQVRGHRTQMRSCDIRNVKDCTISQLLSMAMNMLFMMVRQAQKVKGEALNLNSSIAPRVHRVRRGNTKENMQSCKFSF